MLEKLISYCWNDAVWSKVIAGLIVSSLTLFFGFLFRKKIKERFSIFLKISITQALEPFMDSPLMESYRVDEAARRFCQKKPARILAIIEGWLRDDENIEHEMKYVKGISVETADEVYLQELSDAGYAEVIKLNGHPDFTHQISITPIGRDLFSYIFYWHRDRDFLDKMHTRSTTFPPR